MARLINLQQYAARRNQILDAAQRLVYSKGFERMTIQDVLNELGISKGAFFHYFTSKNDLLEALIERMVEQILTSLEQVVFDPSLSATQKLESYFSSALKWKTARKDFLLRILQAWYLDENAVVRQKTLNRSIERITPYLAQILEQGNKEGCWQIAHPKEMVKMMMYVLQGLSDALSMQLLAAHPPLDRKGLAELVRTYTQAVERLLGAQPGSLVLLNLDDLALWFEPSPESSPPLPAPATSYPAENASPPSHREEKVL